MNYYEELGIRADAETEDIRKAHRRLVKLMHPDHQHDQHMKLLAETQMRRLNTIVSTLLNAEQRGAYDEALRGRHMARPVPVKAWRGVPWWLVSTAAAGIMSVGGIWFLADHFESSFAKPLSIPPQETASVSRPSSSTAVSPHRNTDPLKASAANVTRASVSVITPQDATAPPTVASRPAKSTKAAENVQAWDVPAGPALTSRVLPKPQPLERTSTSRIIPNRSVAARVAQDQVNGHPGSTAASSKDFGGPTVGGALQGNWVYAPKEPEKRKAGFYPPQFIEFKLLQQHQGGLQGQYNARYEVSGMNNPVSPDVSFQVVAIGEGARQFLWHSSNGSRGTLAIQAVDGCTMRIEWRTTVALGPPAFTSGIATLVRQR